MKHFFRIGIVALAVSCVSVHGQTSTLITKDNFMSAIRLGRKEKKTAARFIELIKQAKVDFVLTEEDEQILRKDGRYLGKQGLDGLIETVRDNYRGKEEQPSASKSPGRRFFLDVTPRELAGAYKKNPLQADLAVAGYKGKWLKVEVVVTAILPQMSSNDLNIQARDADKTLLVLRFDRDRYVATFAQLRGGEHLSVSGIFSGVLLGVVNLHKCEINTMPESKKSEQPSPITQTMNNSPGGVQAGRDIIINTQLQPRTVSQPQLDGMVRVLRSHHGKLLLVRLGDQEANHFASQILQAFQSAGWQVEILDIGIQIPQLYGVRLGVPDPRLLSPEAGAIFSSFINSGLAITVTDLSEIRPLPTALKVREQNGIMLHVGLRP
jgi:putative nucleic acid binding protein